MPAVVPVRFKHNAKVYWFSYSDCDPQRGSYVVVGREGGKAFGLVDGDPFELSDEEAGKLRSPLSPIIRVASEDDLAKKEELEAKGEEAKTVFRELAEKRGLDIKPIDVEYMLDSDNAVFHFSSEERVDFRELVRDLASRLHVHVDMRQMGVRDEARTVGGIGHCGEVLCCVRMSSAFQPVSIKMAKEQDLPLNPSKVSGACGRLMCCLRYEYEAYKDFKSRSPKLNATIETPAGPAKVIELNTPKEYVKLKLLETDEAFIVPIGGMECDPESDSPRPCRVCAEAFEEHCPASLKREKLLEIPADEVLKSDEDSKPGKKRRRGGRGRKSGSGGQQGQASQGEKKPAQRGGEAKQDGEAKPGKKRRRGGRGRKSGSGGQQGQRQDGQAQEAKSGEHKQRPGQNSSNLRNPREDGQGGSAGQGNRNRRRRGGGGGGGNQAKRPAEGQQGGQQQGGGSGQRKRKPRRTSGGTGNAPASGENKA
ncbi:MAG: PSP1 domain-containing protein [Coriobacteriales bacterium]|jgi:cell fate regulator YaaT (PSP1 superfamily)